MTETTVDEYSYDPTNMQATTWTASHAGTVSILAIGNGGGGGSGFSPAAGGGGGGGGGGWCYAVFYNVPQDTIFTFGNPKPGTGAVDGDAATPGEDLTITGPGCDMLAEGGGPGGNALQINMPGHGGYSGGNSSTGADDMGDLGYIGAKGTIFTGGAGGGSISDSGGGVGGGANGAGENGSQGTGGGGGGPQVTIGSTGGNGGGYNVTFFLEYENDE